MASTIDRTIPVTNAPLESKPVRDNFVAAANDIEALQSGKASQTDLSNHTGAANPHSGSASSADLSAHVGDATNPHAVTAAQANAIPDIMSQDGELLSHDGTTYTKIGVGTDSHVLTARPGAAQGAKIAWEPVPGGGGGEENVGANVGGQVGVYRDKTGITLNFRTLYSSDGSINPQQEADNVNLEVTNAPNAKGILWSAINTGLPTQVPAGAEGQVPVARAAAATGIAWETPAGGSSPLTTKGDIYSRDASADARLPVGANGTVLSADSSEATGLKWDDPQVFSPTQAQGDLIQRGSGASDERLAIGSADDVLTVVAGAAAWVANYIRSSVSKTTTVGYPFTPTVVSGATVQPSADVNFGYRCTVTGTLNIDLANFTQTGGQCVLSIESSVTTVSFINGTVIGDTSDPGSGNRLVSLIKIGDNIYASWNPSG